MLSWTWLQYHYYLLFWGLRCCTIDQFGGRTLKAGSRRQSDRSSPTKCGNVPCSLEVVLIPARDSHRIEAVVLAGAGAGARASNGVWN